ncbi:MULTISPECIES: iron-containing alcohol dehydrogenase family protein [Listeria]|uniref:iron-containing alcohol dehydrogenase family protein n=1 Tax=Listeria TaxID=1637 RepID=UPI000B58B161|nr:MULTISPECIES: iron-containing alcohol dehydrogenase family protein [Listeria]
MVEELIVRGAPQEYVCTTGAWKTLPEHLKRRRLEKVLVLHGDKSWEVAEEKFPDLPEVTVSFEQYNGDCTYEERDRIVRLVQEKQFEAIIAVGGGKITDLAKAAAHVLRMPVLILPTLASTCAAATPLSVMYDQNGAMICYDVFPESNALVLIEPEIILHSPISLMIAGIGDTLAKWYEADVIISQLENLPVEVEIAYFAANKCRENLLELSVSAIAAMEAGELNDAFIKTVETNILVAGMVGGFGDRYGRTAGAHSIHDALTMIPETHSILHGNKVAYGVFVQLVLENRFDELERLLPFYTALGLPTSLADMLTESLSESDIRAVSTRATEAGETIHMMPGEITADKVEQAILGLEKYRMEKQVR